MKKIALIIIGAMLSIVGCIQAFRYIFDYNTLAQYGKGYVWGSMILLLIGLVLIYFGVRKKKTNR